MGKVFNMNVAEYYAYGFRENDFDAPAMKYFDTRFNWCYSWMKAHLMFILGKKHSIVGEESSMPLACLPRNFNTKSTSLVCAPVMFLYTFYLFVCALSFSRISIFFCWYIKTRTTLFDLRVFETKPTSCFITFYPYIFTHS